MPMLPESSKQAQANATASRCASTAVQPDPTWSNLVQPPPPGIGYPTLDTRAIGRSSEFRPLPSNSEYFRAPGLGPFQRFRVSACQLFTFQVVNLTTSLTTSMLKITREIRPPHGFTA